jgi:hypothetical protein
LNDRHDPLMSGTDLVVDGPADVLEVRVVEELVGVLLHPLADLAHADGPDFRQDVAVAVHEDGLEHVRQHVLDLVRVLLELFAPAQKKTRVSAERNKGERRKKQG